MIILRRMTIALVSIAATSVLSSGVASARSHPVEPIPAATVASNAHPHQAASGRTNALLPQDAGRIKHVVDELVEQDEADTRRAAQVSPGVGLGKSVVDPNGSPATPAATPKQQVAQPGHDIEIPVLAVTALAGLALGVAGSTASRRLRNRYGLAA